MSSLQNWNLLAKYFSGEASFQEQKIVYEWRNKSEDNRKIFEFFQKVWTSKTVSGPLENADIDKIWHEAREKLEAQDYGYRKALQIKGTEKQKEKKRRFFQLGKVAQYAIAALLLIM